MRQAPPLWNAKTWNFTNIKTCFCHSTKHLCLPVHLRLFSPPPQFKWPANLLQSDMLAKQKWSLLSFCSPFLVFQPLIQKSVSCTYCGCSDQGRWDVLTEERACFYWEDSLCERLLFNVVQPILSWDCVPSRRRVVAGSGPTLPVLDFTLPHTTCSWASLVWACAYWIDFLLGKKTAFPSCFACDYVDQ